MEILTQNALSRATPGGSRATLTFPTVTPLRCGRILATQRAGATKDSEDEGVELLVSEDAGNSWSAPRSTFAQPRFDGHNASLKLCYLTETAPGRIVAAGMAVDREAHPGQPLFNADTEGCLPMAILLADSHDDGDTWSDWRRVPLPARLGPPSLTAPLMVLGSGHVALSIETNKTYLDSGTWDQHAVFLTSDDGGVTWSDPWPVAREEGRFNWDLRCAVAPDGRIVTFAWTYDTEQGRYLDIHRRISADGGHSWTAPEPLGISDQAGCPAILPDGRVVVAWVDRFAGHAIRARLAEDIAAPFDAGTEVVLHRQTVPQPDCQNETGALLADMANWSYGLPHAAALTDGTVLVTHYAGTDQVMDAIITRLAP